jgi:hypothetical protein
LDIATLDHGLRVAAGQGQQRQRRADDGRVGQRVGQRVGRRSSARTAGILGAQYFKRVAGGLDHGAPRRAADRNRQSASLQPLDQLGRARRVGHGPRHRPIEQALDQAHHQYR